jgi:hypothetical protein
MVRPYGTCGDGCRGGACSALDLNRIDAMVNDAPPALKWLLTCLKTKFGALTAQTVLLRQDEPPIEQFYSVICNSTITVIAQPTAYQQ